MKCSGGPAPYLVSPGPLTSITLGEPQPLIQTVSSASSTPSDGSSVRTSFNLNVGGQYPLVAKRKGLNDGDFSFGHHNQQPQQKKQKQQQQQQQSEPQDYIPTPNDVETPYSAVQDLEAHQLPVVATGPIRSNTTSYTERPPDTGLNNHDHSLLSYLTVAGIPLAEAEQMYALFGERIAPFIPSLVEEDFSSLPTEADSLLGLAAIHAIARYLPDTAQLRSRLCGILKRRLQDVVFRTPQRSNAAAEPDAGLDKGTMQGLVVLYSCCEASGPYHAQAACREDDPPDMLTVKSITEGFAVKMRIGGVDRSDGQSPLPYIWWLWLYTMSHQYVATPPPHIVPVKRTRISADATKPSPSAAVLHGCARTMWASAGVYRAKRVVEQHSDNVRLRRLVGEAELCLLWESVRSKPGDMASKVDTELRAWMDKWSAFCGRAEGRQLLFHFHFMRFQLCTFPARSAVGSALGARAESLEAAQEFIRCMTALSPISKERLRYMCDYGFVMVAYACVFVIRSIAAAAEAVLAGAQRRKLLDAVMDAAALMQSYSANKGTRPSVYGYALDRLCATSVPGDVMALGPNRQAEAQAQPGLGMAPSFNVSPPTSSTGLVFPPCSWSFHPPQTPPDSSATPVNDSTALNMLASSMVQSGGWTQFGASPNTQQNNSSCSAHLQPEDVGPDDQAARALSELWSLNQSFPLFEDIMLDIPPGES
ncbi:hypothetical protein KVR01_013127 [Diaporthe batatas]|uniref:uncharacterized protein n=1 Tax=Diaporthe batatas TaxID=748121 RepID=UPI001D03A01A|nr:uncharacterized protein KVR01_013127 [Diaporthe batatas]KAG8157137.1 hypothetical protein KVR01_013127 [Diaporthe batatas]